MREKEFLRYKVKVEIKTLYSEKLLNSLWRNSIRVSNVRKINKATIECEVIDNDYSDLKRIVKREGGKIRVIDKKGHIIKLKIYKNRYGLVIGGILFLGILYFLSLHIWAIDVEVVKNVSPYEVRKELNKLGVKQGLRKSNIDVYEVEKKLEDVSSEILWTRVRIEGSTLKVKIEEKVNPPVEIERNEDSVYAKMDGEVKRVYTKRGMALVKAGDMVKKGDVLIDNYYGAKGFEYDTDTQGYVLANTFHEKYVDIRISGEEEVFTGNEDSDIFFEIGGRKIYLKKATKTFGNYDKIEEKNRLYNKIVYREKVTKKVQVNRESVIDENIKKLDNLFKKELPSGAKIVSKESKVEEIKEGTLRIKLNFTVEQNICDR